jgi:hypothetical protein
MKGIASSTEVSTIGHGVVVDSLHDNNSRQHK